MFERLSERSIKVVMYAQEEARRLSAGTVDIDHLLLGLMREPQNPACQVLLTRGITYDNLREHIRGHTASQGGSGPEIPFGAHFRLALEMAWEEAQRLGDSEVEAEHLLLGAVELGEGAGSRLLESDRLSLGRLRWSVLRQRDTYQGRPQLHTPTLDGYCRDITQEVDEGLSQGPLVPRERELERLMHVLGSHLKPFPLLVGDSGVGKTALIRAMVRNVLAGHVFDHLLNARVIALEFHRLVAETKGMEDLYEVFQRIMLEMSRTSDLILVIEDLPWLFTEEFDSKVVMMAQLLLSLLEGGHIRCVGTATSKGYNQLETKEKVLKIFQPVLVPEMSADDTMQVLKAWQPLMERHHHLSIGEESLAVAIGLAKHYSPRSRLPESAIALMDAACAAKVFANLQTRNRLRELERRLRQLREERDLSGQRLDYNRLNAIKAQIAEHEAAIRDLTAGGNGGGTRRALLAEDVKIMLGRNAQ